MKREEEFKTEVREILKNNNNTAQKKYLANRKQLRVWVEEEKFERFKNAAAANSTSMHRLINDYIDFYLFDQKIRETEKQPKHD